MESPEELIKQVKECKTSPECQFVWAKIRECQIKYLEAYDACMNKYDEVRNCPVEESV